MYALNFGISVPFCFSIQHVFTNNYSVVSWDLGSRSQAPMSVGDVKLAVL